MECNLTPKNKKACPPCVLRYIWPMVLNETGAGYLLGYGEIEAVPGSYVYNGNRGPGTPVSNEGFIVTAEEAKIMAKLFRGYAFVKRGVRKQWGKLPERNKQMAIYINERSEPPDDDFINKVESLADFCEKSGGFTVD